MEFNLPIRKYVDGPKKSVSLRLPKQLSRAIDNIAKKKGWPVTDLVVTVLDQYAQHENLLIKEAKNG